MKLQKGKSNQGGILVVTIVICSLVGLMLAAYLSMVSSQHTFTQRSQVWNNTIPLCEAGVEAAMAHVNHISVSTNLAINGWRRAPGGIGFTNEGYLNGGSYTMYIDNGWPPIIKVWGTLKQPLANGDVTRVVQVRTRMNQRFPAAVLARGTVNLGGSGRIDSFNSTNSTDNTGGQYDAAKATDRALVATTLRTLGAINVGNMSVWGSAATGPGGTVTVQPSGGVGDKLWHTANSGFVQAGHHITDANFYIPPANLPSDFNVFAATTLTTLSPLLVYTNGESYKHAILTDGDYKANFVSLRNGDKMLVNAKARLYVSSYVEVQQAASKIQIQPNASLELFAMGFVNVSGGACVNAGGYAINFSIIALTNAPVSYGGNGKLVGTIYAPLSTVNLNGTTDAVGAITCNNFTLSGAMGIHFDEALRANPKIRFLADSWTELKL